MVDQYSVERLRQEGNSKFVCKGLVIGMIAKEVLLSTDRLTNRHPVVNVLL